MGRRYGRRRPWVLRGITLELPRGALVRVEGGNGGGKSTLLRLVAGIEAPTEGRVSGRPPRTGYVPERFPAALPLTAADYLTHLGRVHGLPRAEAVRRAADRLERFGAAAYARTPMAELSKGSSQKVAVAQALLAEICVTVEPDAARACTAAAAGPVRVHAAALLTASTGALLAGAAAAAVALLTGDRSGEGPGTTALAGALAVVACALTGAAVGALCSRPLVRRRGHGILAATLGSLLALVVAASPARGAVSALVAAGRSGVVPLPLTPLAVAVLLAAGAGTAACLAAARRS